MQDNFKQAVINRDCPDFPRDERRAKKWKRFAEIHFPDDAEKIHEQAKRLVKYIQDRNSE